MEPDSVQSSIPQLDDFLVGLRNQERKNSQTLSSISTGINSLASSQSQISSSLGSIQRSMLQLGAGLKQEIEQTNKRLDAQTKSERAANRKASTSSVQKNSFQKLVANTTSGLTKSIKSTLGKGGVLENLLKGSLLFGLFQNPEALVGAFTSIAQASQQLAQVLTSESFRSGMGKFIEFMGVVGGFAIDSLRRTLDGFAGTVENLAYIGQGLVSFLSLDWAGASAAFGMVDWGDFANLAAGIAGLSLVLRPFKTAGFAFKALQNLWTGIPKLWTAVTSATSAIGGFGGALRQLGSFITSPGKWLPGALKGGAGYAGGAAGLWLLLEGLFPARVADGRVYDDDGNMIQRQSGGKVPGTGIGDSVPSLLEPGEYVLNKKAVKAIGLTALNDLNFQRFARFQEGGIVPLGQHLVSQGYQAWQHPDFNLDSGYTGSGSERTWQRPYNSSHNHGEALDFPLSHNTAKQLDELYAYLNTNREKYNISELLWRTEGHQDHLHVAVGSGDGSYGPPNIQNGSAPNQNTSSNFSNLLMYSPLQSIVSSISELLGAKGGIGNVGTSTGLTGTGVSNAPGAKSYEDLLKLAVSAGFSEQQAKVMAAVALAESGGDPSIDTVKSGLDPSKSNEYSVGLWQVNWKAHGDWLKQQGITENDLRNPQINARIAKKIFDMQGYQAWGAYTNGTYRSYMPGSGGPQMKVPYPSAADMSSDGGNVRTHALNERQMRSTGAYSSSSQPIIVPMATPPTPRDDSATTSGAQATPTMSSTPNNILLASDLMYRFGLGLIL